MEYVLLDSEPKLESLDEIDDDFAYPVTCCDWLGSFLGEEIIGLYEYRLKKSEDLCVGLYFEFKGGGFSILEEDSCLSVVDGVSKALMESASLLRI